MIERGKLDSLVKLIAGSQSFIIVSHYHPDGDALGSGVALLSYLKSIDKEAILLLPDRYPKYLDFIVPEDLKTFVKFYQKGIKQATACAKFESSDLINRLIKTCDCIFALDLNSFQRAEIANLKECLYSSKAKKVLIDHHLHPNVEEFDLIFSKQDISSTCEHLFYILKAMPEINNELQKLPKEALYALMTGMSTDTNNFANSVFPTTFRMAEELILAGVNRESILANLYQQDPIKRIKLLAYLIEHKLKITPEGMAYIIFDKETQGRYDFEPGLTEGFVNKALSLNVVKMSLFLTEEAEHYKVSVRSKEGVNANLFAMTYFHGGGHLRAAGGKLTFEELDTETKLEEYLSTISKKIIDFNLN